LTGPAEINFLPGEAKSFYLQLNARDGFIPDIGEFEITPRDAGITISVSRGALAAGRLQVSVTVDDDTGLGDYQLDASVTWISSSGGMKTITWPIVAHVLSALKPSKPGKPSGDGDAPRKVRKEVGVALIWRTGDSQNGAGAPAAGTLEDITGSELAEAHPESYGDLDGVEAHIPTIVLEEEFPGWRDYKRGKLKRGASDQVMGIRKEKYALALGVTIANLSQQERRLRKAHLAWEEGGQQGEEPTRPMDDEQLRRAVNEAAYGTLAFLLDMDKVLTELDALESAELAAN
jgi:hypothetical protein